MEIQNPKEKNKSLIMKKAIVTKEQIETPPINEASSINQKDEVFSRARIRELLMRML